MFCLETVFLLAIYFACGLILNKHRTLEDTIRPWVSALHVE